MISRKDINKSICILSVYWGNLPDWFPIFLHSCARNNNIMFIILSDNNKLNYQYDNIKVHYFSMSDFNKLASKKLGLEINIKHPYKICDFKPAFGKIFNDILHGYQFWGYCDNDIVFGEIDTVIKSNILEEYDVLSFYRGFLSGPFCIFRNSNNIVDLFKSIPTYKKIFCSDRHYAMDENIIRPELTGVSLKKVICFIVFLLKEIFMWGFIYNFKELRYQFQWYFKKRMLRHNSPVDMTEAVWKAQKSNKLKAYFKEVLISDEHLKRVNRIHNWKMKYVNGKLFNMQSKREIFAFHFRKTKLNNDFTIKSLETKEWFYITNNGITN